MLCMRRWPNIEPTLGQFSVSAWLGPQLGTRTEDDVAGQCSISWVGPQPGTRTEDDVAGKLVRAS